MTRTTQTLLAEIAGRHHPLQRSLTGSTPSRSKSITHKVRDEPAQPLPSRGRTPAFRRALAGERQPQPGEAAACATGCQQFPRPESRTSVTWQRRMFTFVLPAKGSPIPSRPRTKAWSCVATGQTPARVASSNIAVSVASGPGLCVRLLQTECIAVAALPSCTGPVDCSHAVTAIGLPMRANRNRHTSAGLGNHKRSECSWAEARTCLRSFRRNRKACTGGRMSDGAASMMPPKSDQPLA